MGFADAAKAKQLADALERSKKATRRTSSASTDNSQLTSSPPTVYRLGPMNIPDNMEGMTKLLHSELQKIEQSQSVILSVWEKLNTSTDTTANVKTVYGVGPDDAGDVSPQDISINTATVATSVVSAGIDTPLVNNASHAGSDLWVDATPGGANVVIKSTTTALVQSDGQVTLQADGGNVNISAAGGYIEGGGAAYVSGADGGFIQNAPWVDNGAGVLANYGFALWLNGDGAYTSYHVIGELTGQYYYTQWIMGYDGTGQQYLEMRSNGQLVHNGGVIASERWTESMVNMSIALAREEIKKEIYAELLALNPGIVIPQQ